jgi:hypothetical protein
MTGYEDKDVQAISDYCHAKNDASRKQFTKDFIEICESLMKKHEEEEKISKSFRS